jgi:hypothetical protein
LNRLSVRPAPARVAGGTIIVLGLAFFALWALVHSHAKPATKGVTIPANVLYARLHDVTCVLPGRCIAVGNFLPVDKDAASGDPDGDGQAAHTLVESFDGTNWHHLPSPDLGRGGAELSSISCPGVDDCVAVGFYIPARFTMQAPTYPLIESYDGKRWRVIPSPSVGPNSVLESVSCPNSSSCTAVGYETTNIGQNPGDSFFIEDFNGQSWTVTSTSPPAGTNSELDSVSCPSTSSCVAVGNAAPKSDTTVTLPLIEVFSGGLWTATTTPAYGTGSGILYDVSCMSVGDCVAVGNAQTGQGSGSALVLSLTGSTWTAEPAAQRQTGDPSLTTLGCAGDDSCLVAGTSLESGKVIVAQTDGASWNALDVPSSSDNVQSVACTTASKCVLVGFVYVNGVGNTTVLTATVSGSTVTVEKGPDL